MPYLVDSNWVIPYLDDDPNALVVLDQLAADGLAISIVTYMEVYQGVLRSPDPRAAEAKLRAFLSAVPILPLTLAVARRCAGLRERLGQQGKQTRRRALDLLIAATALEHNLTLVTQNRDDFKDIPGLKVR